MGGASSDLETLHRLHEQLKAVTDQLERGPRLIRAREQITQQKQQILDQKREFQRQLKKSADDKSLQLRTNEAKLEQLNFKLNMAASNKEYDILRGQIQADTMANSVLEDEILDLLDQIDQAKVAVAQAEQDLADSKAEGARVAAQVAAAEPGLRAEAARLEALVKEAAEIIPPEVRPLYTRLVQSYGPAAFALADGKICTGCYVNIPPQTQVELNQGKVLVCKTCGRILYAPSQAASAAGKI